MLSRLVTAAAVAVVPSLGSDDFFPSPPPAGTAVARLLPAKSPRPPSDLRLASVTVLMRHGSRTPLHLVPGPLAAGQRWPVSSCYTLAETDRLRLDLYDPDHAPAPVLEPPYRVYLPGGAQPGALTRLGQAQMLRLGQRLRQDYLASGLLGDGPEGLFCRSTAVLRCVQSLRCVLVGLLVPGEEDESDGEPPSAPPVVRVAVRPITEENLFPNFRLVPEVRPLNSANSAALLGRLDGYVASRRRLAEILGVAAIGQTAAPGLPQRFTPMYFARDDLAARLAHGASLPPQLVELYGRLNWLCAMELLVEEMGPPVLWDQALPYCIGTWVHELASNVARLQQSVSGASSGAAQGYHRLALYSSHDSMLMPVLLALGLDPRTDIEWPPFAAAIVFEFYHRQGADATAGGGEEAIWCRVLYNDQALLLPGCQGEFAPLSALSGCLLRHAREPDDFVAASREAGRRLNAWYREQGLRHLETWPY